LCRWIQQTCTSDESWD